MKRDIAHLPQTPAQIDAYPRHLHWQTVILARRVKWLADLNRMIDELDASDHPAAASGLRAINQAFASFGEQYPFSKN